MRKVVQQRASSTSERRFRFLLSASGILGCLALLVYFTAPFVIFPFPPSNASDAQIISNITQFQTYYLLAAWLQGTGTLLIVLFALGLVHLSRAWNRFSGIITLLASATIVMLSLTEGMFFIEAVQAAGNGHLGAAVTSFDLTFVFIHTFFIAPSLLLSLAFVLRGSDLLPRAFWASALVLGIGFQGLGLIGLFLTSMLPSVALLVLMIGWVVAASIWLSLRRSGLGRTTIP